MDEEVREVGFRRFGAIDGLVLACCGVIVGSISGSEHGVPRGNWLGMDD